MTVTDPQDASVSVILNRGVNPSCAICPASGNYSAQSKTPDACIGRCVLT
jgi:hypothetical protein